MRTTAAEHEAVRVPQHNLIIEAPGMVLMSGGVAVP